MWIKSWWRAVYFWHLIHEYEWECFRLPCCNKWSIFTLHENWSLKLNWNYSNVAPGSKGNWILFGWVGLLLQVDKLYYVKRNIIKYWNRMQNQEVWSNFNKQSMLNIHLQQLVKEFVKECDLLSRCWIFVWWIIQWGWLQPCRSDKILIGGGKLMSEKCWLFLLFALT